MKMIRPQTNCPGLKSRGSVSAITATLLATACVMVFCANAGSAQNLRRQMRIQKKIDKKLNRPAGNQNRIAPAGDNEEANAANQPGTAAPRTGIQPGGHSLDGIRQRGIRSFFTQEEASLLIPGFGNSPAALLIIFRQLDLTPEQKIRIREIRRQMGNRLQFTRRELGLLEAQLEEAIYGTGDPASLDNFDPARVRELTDQVAEKRSEMMRLQTDIESHFRQILTPDQFYVFRELVREMVLPGRRIGINPANRQQQMQRRLGIPPNPQNRPDPQNPPDND